VCNFYRTLLKVFFSFQCLHCAVFCYLLAEVDQSRVLGVGDGDAPRFPGQFISQPLAAQ